MTDRSLKNWLGLLFIIFHFTDIVLLFIFCHIGWFDELRLQMAVSILTPLLGHYTQLVVTDLMDQKYVTGEGKKVNPFFAFVVIFIPVVFITVLTGIIIDQALSAASAKAFAAHLGYAEAAFGIYMGIIFRTLFKKQKASPGPTSSKAPATTPRPAP